jgi:hypothetical protein
MNKETIRRATDKTIHWRNEQILDCIERVEDRSFTREEIASLGEIKMYGNGSAEFFWKGKKMIYFSPPIKDSNLNMLDLEAIHLYEDNKSSRYSKHNKEE